MLPALEPVLRSYAVRLLRGGGPASISESDLVQSGWVGVLLAERSFDSSRGVPFEAYALARAWTEMVDELRRNGRPRKEGHTRRPMLVTLNGQMGAPVVGFSNTGRIRIGFSDPGPGSFTPIHSFSDDCTQADESEHEQLKAEVGRAIDNLPLQERKCVQSRLHGLRLDDIAAAQGYHPTRACQLLRAAEGRLREALA